MNIKKLLSVVTVLCFTLSFILNDTLHAVVNVKIEPNLSYTLNDFVIPQSCGRITDGKSFESKQIIINIQDLHCHPEVQKNISKILSALDDKYGLKNVYVEGGYGNVDTSWLCNIKDKDIKNEIIENLVSQGRLTGSEYYSVLSNKSSLLKGIEDEPVHKANIVRLGKILEKKPFFEGKLKILDKDLEFMEAKYFGSRNRDFNKLVERHKAGDITTDKYYKLLLKCVYKINDNPDKYSNLFPISLDNYPNINTFLELNDISKQIKYKKLSSQLSQFMQMLKSKLPYNDYNSLLQKTGNFTKMDELYIHLAKIAKVYNFDINTNFPELKKFFEYTEKKQSINPIKLIQEEKRLVEEIRVGFSKDISEVEVSFLADFYSYFQNFMLNKLSAEDYEYFNQRFDKFKLVWGKYSFKNRIADLSDDFNLLSEFYKVNCERNIYFLKNIEPLRESAPVKRDGRNENGISADKLSGLLKNSEIIVIVTGGFHTEGLKNLLQEKRISYLTITPNVTQNTRVSSEIYEQLAKFQAKILANSLQLGLFTQLSFIEKATLELRAVTKNDIPKLLQEMEDRTGIRVNKNVSDLQKGIIVFDNGTQIQVNEKEGHIEITKIKSGGISESIQESIKALIEVENLSSAVGKAMIGQVDDLINIAATVAAEHYLITGNGLIPDILNNPQLNKKEIINGVKIELLARFPEKLEKSDATRELVDNILNKAAERSDWLRVLVSIDLLKGLLIETVGLQNITKKEFEAQSQEQLNLRIESSKPAKREYVKDAPILGYRITSDRFEDLPEVIQKHLGVTDRTKYTRKYLSQNIGSIIALQMNGANPDFYVIGKETYEKKYKVASVGDVNKKNAKLMKGLRGVEHISDLISSGNENLVGALKIVPVGMIRMSEIGYAVEQEVIIQSPWGEQTKPAGKDAFLVFDTSNNQYYMVNTDESGLPLSYVQMSKETKIFNSDEEMYGHLGQFNGTVLFLGHGSKSQFKNVDEALREVDSIVQEMDTKYGKGKWIAVFGGDSYNAEKLVIAHIIKYLKFTHNIPIMAIQSDVVIDWGGVDKYIDYVRYIPTQKDEAGKTIWGGVRDGKPVGPTSVYLGDRFTGGINPILKRVVTVGGGPIALDEIKLAYEKGVPITYVRAETKYPNVNGLYGFLEGWVEQIAGSLEGKTRASFGKKIDFIEAANRLSSGHISIDETMRNIIISSENLAGNLAKYRNQTFFTDSNNILGDISHIDELDFIIPKEYTSTSKEGNKVKVYVGVVQGSVVFYMDLKGAEVSEALYEQVKSLGEAEIIKQLREGNTRTISQVKDICKVAQMEDYKNIQFGSGITVSHYKSGKKMIYNEIGSLVVSPDYFIVDGELNEETISVKLGELETIRSGEGWAMGEAILTNLDDVENIDEFKSSLKAAVKTGNGLMVVKPSVLDTIGEKFNPKDKKYRKYKDKSEFVTHKTKEIAKLVRTKGAGLYVNLLDCPINELGSKKKYYEITGVTGCIYLGVDGRIKIYNYATQTEKDVDEIRNYKNPEELSNEIRKSRANFKMLYSSDLRKLLKGGLRDIEERFALIEVLKSTLLSLYNPEEISSDFVENVASGWDWDKLPQIAPGNYQSLINAVESKESSIKDILAKMGISEGVSHSVKTYVLDKLTNDVKGTAKEPELEKLQRDFLRAIVKAMLAKDKLISAEKVNGLADVELTRILGQKLYEQIAKNTIGAGILITPQVFMEQNNVNAAEFFAMLNFKVRELSTDTRPEAINALVELIPLADQKIRLDQQKQKETLNANSINAILEAA